MQIIIWLDEIDRLTRNHYAKLHIALTWKNTEFPFVWSAIVEIIKLLSRNFSYNLNAVSQKFRDTEKKIDGETFSQALIPIKGNNFNPEDLQFHFVESTFIDFLFIEFSFNGIG